MADSDRTYPLRKPKNHRLPVPRYTLTLGDDVGAIYTTYIGVQQHSENKAATYAKTQAIRIIEDWINSDTGPSAFESFTQIEGHDAPNTTSWVCYWTDRAKYQRSLQTLSLPSIYTELSTSARSSVGLWVESFSTAASRLETNYSGLDYLPGLARIPDTTVKEHDLATYWGAARDRIPDSAHDLFSTTASEPTGLPTTPRGIGQRLIGTNRENMVHIRSGQFWEKCNAEETEAYETKLEPTLRAGLQYLCTNPVESGAMGIRYLRNITSPHESGQEVRKETCGAGFFRNLSDLEKWAKGHKSHLAIYTGALKHYKMFPENRMMRTWHEVSVLREGEARFEYVNCVAGTGVTGSLAMEVKSL